MDCCGWWSWILAWFKKDLAGLGSFWSCNCPSDILVDVGNHCPFSMQKPQQTVTIPKNNTETSLFKCHQGKCHLVWHPETAEFWICCSNASVLLLGAENSFYLSLREKFTTATPKATAPKQAETEKIHVSLLLLYDLCQSEVFCCISAER